jgi:hypothetical protein
MRHYTSAAAAAESPQPAPDSRPKTSSPFPLAAKPATGYNPPMKANPFPQATDAQAMQAMVHFAIATPDLLLRMLVASANRYDNPAYALDALECVGSHLSESLEPSMANSAQLQELAGICVWDGPESLDRLDASLGPLLWPDQRLASHIFDNLTEFLDDQWDPADGVAATAAKMASQWIEPGLNQVAWVALAKSRGPAWRAFAAEHAVHAKADPQRLPLPEDAANLGFRACARLRKALGFSGNALHGRWMDDILDASDASARLAVHSGARDLFRAIAAEGEGFGSDVLVERLAKALSQALSGIDRGTPWQGLVASCVRRAVQAGLDPAAIECPIPPGYGLPHVATAYHASRFSFVAAKGSMSLPSLLALSSDSRCRDLAASLGVDFEQAGAEWLEATTRAVERAYKPNPLRMGSEMPPQCDREELDALVEAKLLSLAADAARLRQNGLPSEPSMGKARL